tara:strand:+ start:91 stop:348 length:258 start_codon:yes stop_codon:yes gene_type:complete
LLPPDEALSHPEWDRANAMPSNAIIGTAEEVTKGLQELAEQTDADELFLHCSSYGMSERIAALEIIAEDWGLKAEQRPEANAVLQ